MVAVSLILATSVFSTASAGLFDLFGPTAEEKREYELQIVGYIRRDVIDAQLEQGKILSYDYLDEEAIELTNGTDARFVFSVISTDSSNFGKYHLVVVALFEQHNEQLQYSGVQYGWIESAAFTNQVRDEKVKEKLQLSKEGLISNGYLASMN